MPTERMGPPPGASPPMRMTASWSGSNDPPYTSLWHEDVPQWRARLGSATDRQAPSGAEAMQKAPVAVHHRSACSGVKALRNTSDARRQAAKLCYRFGPLTPSARSANLIAGDGTKNGLSRSEQKTLSTTQNNRLTGKAPYKSAANLTFGGASCRSAPPADAIGRPAPEKGIEDVSQSAGAVCGPTRHRYMCCARESGRVSRRSITITIGAL